MPDKANERRPLSFAGLSNEEELKVRFLVPLLERLGIYRDDLHFEDSFSFKAGRGKLGEEVGPALRERRPRLDVLVTQGGRNLFVIEAKAPDVSLTDQDGLQAISYARLVHPIAPYALVTNGQDSDLYDTVSRRKIEPASVKLNGGWQISLPGQGDFAALDVFLRLTPENLLRFCSVQVADNIRALKGSEEDLTRKYIPNLHTPRKTLGQALASFIRTSDSAFGLIADSGIGKTCCMCYRAESLLRQGYPVLFLRGSELEQRLVDRIADEFAWIFSESSSPQALISRLSGMVADKSLLILVDAIDEWNEPSSRHQLGALMRHLTGSRVKLVLSCKSVAWSSFTADRGVPTDLATYVAKHDGQPGFHIGSLEDHEFTDALAKYKEVYGFQGVWDERLLNEARRSPFFMRIAFEVAKDRGLGELRESSLEVFEHYYRSCQARMLMTRELADGILASIARLLFEANTDRIEYSTAHSSLRLSQTEPIPEELFLSGVLEKVAGGGSESGAVRFAFEGLRDYVIAFRAFRWPDQPTDAFRQELRHLHSTGVREEALVSYYKLAPEAHKREFDSQIYESGQNLLGAYKDIIRSHFSAFANAFPPGDVSSAGFVVEANLRTKEGFGYGVRSLRAGDSEVLILPTTRHDWTSDSLSRVGAGGLTYPIPYDWSEAHNAHEELLSRDFARLLPQIIRQGELNEAAAPELSHELLAAAVVSKLDSLRPPNGGGHESLPIAAGRIRYLLEFWQHWNRLWSAAIEAKLAAGEIPVMRSGSSSSYSPPPPTELERQDLIKQCRDRIAKHVLLGPPRFLPLDNIAARLKRSVSWLGEDATIEASSFEQVDACIRGQHSDLLEYFRRFFERFLYNYERLVATNFPTLKNHFALFKLMPVLVRLSTIDGVRNQSDRMLLLSLWVPEERIPDQNQVESVTIEDFRASEAAGRSGAPVVFRGREYRGVRSQSWRMDSLLGSVGRHYHNLQLRYGTTVLRDFTYSWIDGELAGALRGLGELYGIRGLRGRL